MRPVFGRPCSNIFWIRHFWFSLADLDSSSAYIASKVSISSPFLLMLCIFSFSKNTSISNNFNSRIVSRSTTVFRAKRVIDLVITRSIFPFRQSSSKRINSGRLSFVPVIPSSAYTPANSQPTWLLIYSL